MGKLISEKRFIIFFTFILVYWSNILAYSQKKIIVDSITKAPSETLPFDQEFDLFIPTRSTKVRLFSYVQIVGSNNFPETIGKIQKRGTYSKIKSLLPSNVSIDSSSPNKQKFIVAQFRDTSILNPGKRYFFFWSEDVNEEAIKLYDTYDSLQRQLVGEEKVCKIYKKLGDQNLATFGYSIGFPVDYETNYKMVTIGYREGALKDKYSDIYKKDSLFSTQVTNSSSYGLISNSSSSIKILSQLIVEKSREFDPELKSKVFKDVNKSMRGISKLGNIDSQGFTMLMSGLVNMECNICTPVSHNNFDRRLTNLQASLALTEELFIVSESLSLTNTQLLSATKALQQLREDLKGLLPQIIQIVKGRQEIKNILFESDATSTVGLTGSTHILSFESRNKLSIAPDFGFVTTRVGRDGANPYAFVPYLGFHVNLRPLNRDVSFWSYRHKPIHFLSLFMGYSLVDIGNGPKMSPGADSVASFFSKDKGTFLTGIGVRLCNVIRITYGQMWYFSFPKSSSLNIYETRKLKSWPFIGLSLDLAIKDLVNGIIDVFQQVPRKSVSQSNIQP